MRGQRGNLCDKLDGRRSHFLFALQTSSIDSQLFDWRSWFLPTPPAFDALVRRSPLEYCQYV